jgi:hypothetical protein
MPLSRGFCFPTFSIGELIFERQATSRQSTPGVSRMGDILRRSGSPAVDSCLCHVSDCPGQSSKSQTPVKPHVALPNKFPGDTDHRPIAFPSSISPYATTGIT